MYTLEVLAI